MSITFFNISVIFCNLFLNIDFLFYFVNISC
nr:MAG TPA: hypothetical protein [Bacteriophage sp.]